MKNNILTLAIMLTVGVILAGSLLMPVINDAIENNSVTYTNTGAKGEFVIDGDDDYELKSAQYYADFTINGNKININTFAGNGTLVITDKCRVAINGHYISLYDESGTRSSNIDTSSKLIVMKYDATARTFTHTVYTDLTDTTVANTYTYNVEKNIVYVMPGGDYIRLATDGGDSPVEYYVNNLNQVVTGGAYTTGDLDTSYYAQGETVSVGQASYSGSATATTAVVTNGVIKGSNYTVSITDGTNTESFTPFTIFVPAKVKGYTSDQTMQNSLYGTIPIMVIIALVLVSISAITMRRDD